MARVRGFTPPFSPSGRASIVPQPPWHYAADFLTISFTAGERRVEELLPPGLTPDSSQSGVLCTASFALWQACSESGDELLDPARAQYTEFLVFLSAHLGVEPVCYCPYIYVSSDVSMARGWLLGYPKKIASVYATRSFQLTSHAAPASAAGGRFAGTVSLHGRRLAEGTVTLERPADSNVPFFGSKAIVARRHFASLYEGEHQRPAVDELTRLKGENFQISPIVEGSATLAFFPSPTEELDVLRPQAVLAGYRYVVAMTNRHNVKIADLRGDQ